MGAASGSPLPLGWKNAHPIARQAVGVFLGVVEMSSVFYVGTERCVIRARCVKRRRNAERAPSDLLAKVVGALRQPVTMEGADEPTLAAPRPMTQGKVMAQPDLDPSGHHSKSPPCPSSSALRRTMRGGVAIPTRASSADGPHPQDECSTHDKVATSRTQGTEVLLDCICGLGT